MNINKLKIAGITLTLLSATLPGCTSTHQQESTGQYIDSAAITTKVKTSLLADETIHSLPITVKTYKHTVQLSGFVKTNYQKQRAVSIAKSVPGVYYVHDSLVIRK